MSGDFVPGDVSVQSYRLRDEAQENYDRWLWRLVFKMSNTLTTLTEGIDRQTIMEMRDGLNEAHRKLIQSRMESARPTGVAEAAAVAQSIDMASRHGVRVFDPNSVPVFGGGCPAELNSVSGRTPDAQVRTRDNAQSQPFESAPTTDPELIEAIDWGVNALHGEHRCDYRKRERLAWVLMNLKKRLANAELKVVPVE
jgi:hypothetical protein